MGKLIKKESEALYTKCFGSIRDKITSTFKELKKLILGVRSPGLSLWEFLSYTLARVSHLGVE